MLRYAPVIKLADDIDLVTSPLYMFLRVATPYPCIYISFGRMKRAYRVDAGTLNW